MRIRQKQFAKPSTNRKEQILCKTDDPVRDHVFPDNNAMAQQILHLTADRDPENKLSVQGVRKQGWGYQ